MQKESMFKLRFDYQKYKANMHAIDEYRKGEALSILLDSSLITPTKSKQVDFKLIDMGNYYQIYYYPDTKLKTVRERCVTEEEKLDKKLKKAEKVDENNSIGEIVEPKKIIDYTIEELDTKIQRVKSRVKLNEKPKTSKKEVLLKNINRSKNEMLRLVKTNEEEFKTFITLTFDATAHKVGDIDINDIKDTNKKFDIWRTYIKRLKSDFKYVCVPEYQKRGAVHYHLLTNIDYTDFSLLSKEEKKLWQPKAKKWQIGRNIKGWSYGFSMVQDMKDIKVVNYMAKYMTKDIDNRLWGHRKYLYSTNLKKPIVRDISFDDLHDFAYFVNNFDYSYKLQYGNSYKDWLGNSIVFMELVRPDKATKEFELITDDINEQLTLFDGL